MHEWKCNTIEYAIWGLHLKIRTNWMVKYTIDFTFFVWYGCKICARYFCAYSILKLLRMSHACLFCSLFSNYSLVIHYDWIEEDKSPKLFAIQRHNDIFIWMISNSDVETKKPLHTHNGVNTNSKKALHPTVFVERILRVCRFCVPCRMGYHKVICVMQCCFIAMLRHGIMR